MPTDASAAETVPSTTASSAATVDALSAVTTSDGNIKETIESILVAFILAFIFRAYVVEAFVIPTGSMAPTLEGAHMRFQCTDCGYRFTVNYSGRSVGDDVIIPDNAYVDWRGKVVPKVFGIACPNCGAQVPRLLGPHPTPDNGELLGDSDNDATAPPVYYGDRILVLKYAYLLNEPARWDVVVFKTPYTPERTVPPFTMNYIKRLAGKPFESLMILDGDVYAAPIDPKTPADQIPKLDIDVHQFKIQRKSPVAQSDLWRIVFDNDYPGHREDWSLPWQVETPGGAGWSLPQPKAASRTFAFDSAAGEGWISFHPEVNQETRFNRPLTEWLAYDITRNQQGGGEEPDTSDLGNPRNAFQVSHNVSDVKLSATYERTSGEGPLRLELSKLDDVFTAEIWPDSIRIARQNPKEPGKNAEKMKAFRLGAGPARIDFQNVDYRVSLRINGSNVLDMEYDPDIDNLLAAYRSGTTFPRPRVRIGAANQSARVSHVSLWRDIYYTNDMSYTPNWASPNHKVNLGKDEYFVLGDNSLMSGDARVFATGVDLPDENLKVDPGRVPGRFMLGKAFFVYWPAGYRPFSGAPGLIPNFADMRFIH